MKIVLRFSLLLLIFILAIFVIPVNYQPNCLSYISGVSCEATKSLYGIPLFKNTFEFVYQIATFQASLYVDDGLILDKNIKSIFYFLTTFILINIVLNKFILKLEIIPNFLKKSKYINLDNKSLYYFILSIIVLIIGLFLLEMVSRFALPPDPKTDFLEDIIIYDKNSGWSNKPNISEMRFGENNYPINITHNKYGFRSMSPEINHSKKIVLLIGDSFVYGVGLDYNETLDYNLQNYLGNEYQVINGGVNGYSGIQELYAIKKVVSIVKPNYIINAIFMNDLKENFFPEFGNLSKPIYIYENFSLNDEIIKNINETNKRFNLNHESLDFHNKIYSSYNNFFSTPNNYLKNHSKIFRIISSKPFQFLNIKRESFRHSFYVYNINKSDLIDVMYRVECSVMADIKEITEKENIKLLTYYIPVRIEIETEKIKPTIEQYYDLSLANSDMDIPSDYFENCAEAYNIDYISLKKPFETERNGLYNKYGDHWSPKATKIASEIIGDHINNMQ